MKTIALSERKRRAYKNDQQWLTVKPTCAVERIRQARLHHQLSAAQLASLMGIPPRLVKYHEERQTPDELIPLDYLKSAGKALYGDESHFIDGYFRWADGAYGTDIDAFRKRKQLTIAALQKRWNVGAYRLQSWRLQRSRPPRAVYEQLIAPDDAD